MDEEKVTQTAMEPAQQPKPKARGGQRTQGKTASGTGRGRMAKPHASNSNTAHRKTGTQKQKSEPQNTKSPQEPKTQAEQAEQTEAAAPEQVAAKPKAPRSGQAGGKRRRKKAAPKPEAKPQQYVEPRPEPPEAPEKPQTPEPAAVAEPAEAAAAPEMPEKAMQEPKAAQLPQATEPPEPGDDEPELTPEQRAAAERRKAEITRTVQVSIEQIEDAEAEQAEKEADTPESAGSKVGRAVRLLIGWLLLVVLLVLTFGAALFLFASLHNTKKDISRSLQIQFSVFQNDMERYFDQLAVMGVNLSEDMSAEVDKELALRQMSFAQLNDSPEVLNALEEEMIEPLCRRLRQTGCSGAFVLLDATVNTRMEGAEHSRAGLYVQKSGADTPTVPLLLYRGSAEVGKTHSVMPHRKWRMEFQTDQFPDYDRWMTPGSAPLYQSYTLTERFELPGTSEEVQLFLLPLRGRDGTIYGLCGFEISESFFKQNFAQPTGFDRLSCLLAPAGDGLAADAALSSGTTGGYYHAPRNTLVLRSMGGGLTQLTGPDSAYAGISQLCRLSESQSYRLAVCIPMADYRRLVFSGNLQMLLIGLFIAFFVVFCCMNFHRRILSPAFRQFEEDRRESRRRMDELQLERQQMQTELSRLADVCRNESVPDAFQTFVAGIPTLTKTERRIFDGYAAGLRTREIVEQLDIKDSTLRFHNKNIYEKLGVSSLKQLQQFVAILNSGSGSAPDEK